MKYCAVAALGLLAFASNAFAADVSDTTKKQNESPRIETSIGGFIALDVFNWIKVEDRRNKTNIGIGTINLDARARYDQTRLKIKLDLDGQLQKPYNIFEEATVTQGLARGYDVVFGKGVVPLHQKHYGVITDSYVDGGSRVGNYYWNFGDQDRKYLASVQIGNKDWGFKNSFTFYGDSENQVVRKFSGDFETQEVDNASGRGGKVTVLKSGDPMKGFDPNDQRGVADKIEVFVTDNFSMALAGLVYWNRLDPQMNKLIVTSGRYFDKQNLEIWYETQFGRSSSYRYFFKDKQEILAQVGAEYYLTDMVSVLGNAEIASFKFLETQDKSGKRTLDYDNAKFTEYKGTLMKGEAGAAVHISDRATLTSGVLYEVAKVEIAGKTKNTENHGFQYVSSFTFSF